MSKSEQKTNDDEQIESSSACGCCLAGITNTIDSTNLPQTLVFVCHGLVIGERVIVAPNAVSEERQVLEMSLAAASNPGVTIFSNEVCAKSYHFYYYCYCYCY